MSTETLIKSWYNSKTVWSGILKITAGLIVSVSQLLAGELEPQLFATGLISAAWGIYDIIIRFKTNKSIK